MKTTERNEELKKMMNAGIKGFENKFKICCRSWTYDKPYGECALLAGMAMKNMVWKIQTEIEEEWFDLIELKGQWITQYNIGFEDSFTITFEVLGNKFNNYTELRITYWTGFENEKDNNDETVRYETETIAKIVNEELNQFMEESGC